MGIALWSDGDLEGAQKQLEVTTQLLECIRKENRNNADYKLSLYELQTTSYQILQRILVGKRIYHFIFLLKFLICLMLDYLALNRQNEALVIAERGRNRIITDTTVERQIPLQNKNKNRLNRNEEFIPNNIDQITDIVNRQRASVLYFSIAAGFLYAWLIVPTKGTFNVLNLFLIKLCFKIVFISVKVSSSSILRPSTKIARPIIPIVYRKVLVS